jgi:AraC family transcriptional regulator
MDLNLRAGEFYGHILRSRTISGFNVVESAYNAQPSIPLHSHELANLCVVLNGRYTERFGRVRADRSALEVIFHPPGVVHTEDHYESGRHLLIEIEPNRLEGVETSSEPLFVRNEFTVRLAVTLHREFQSSDQFSALAIEGIVLELMAHTLRHKRETRNPRPPAWLLRLKEYLQEGFPTSSSLAGLADIAGVHPVYLASAFRKFEGCTVGEYVRRLRIDHACLRMVHSNDSLAQISLECGFADQTHFTRAFKRATGMTPAEYRRSFRINRRLIS